MGAAEFMEKFKESMKNTPPIDKILMATSICCGCLFVFVCLWIFITSLFTFNLTNFIISIYGLFVFLLNSFLYTSSQNTIGGVMIILGEIQFSWYLNKLSFMKTHFGRGVFYFYIGSLLFAVVGLESGLLWFCILTIAIVMMVVGIVQIIYHFAGKILNGKFNQSGDEKQPLTKQGLELHDPNFDPNIYATTYVSIDDKGDAEGSFV